MLEPTLNPQKIGIRMIKKHRKNFFQKHILWFSYLGIVFLIALILWIRYFVAGGDISCVFSEDPALCKAIKDNIK